jgi:hypothetical protein
MRHFLLSASLILSIGLTACADHTGTVIALDSPTPPPIGGGDVQNITPTTAPGTGSLEAPAPGGSNGFTPGGTTAGASGSTNTGTAGTGASGLGGGNPPGGSPVPEPGTMLLVGTGLAGAAFMRRRRQQPQVESEA